MMANAEQALKEMLLMMELGQFPQDDHVPQPRPQHRAAVQTPPATQQAEVRTNTESNKKTKRQRRDDSTKKSKVLKQSVRQVPRLPESILQQLDEKPQIQDILQEVGKPIGKAIHTTQFKVSEHHNKPMASTSGHAHGTNFKVKVMPQKTTDISQNSGIPNFKNDYLAKRHSKLLPSANKYKRHRSAAVLAKF